MSKKKPTHLQKHYLKILCRLIYYIGICDCWYEDSDRSRTHKIIYKIWIFFMNSFLILNTINEILACTRSDLTVRERNDLIQFSFGHISVCAKYMFLMLQKDRIKVLFKRLVDGSRSTFTSSEVEKKSVKKAIAYSVGLALATYGTLALSVVDAYLRSRKAGIISC
uniref:Odorant receptor n=1 Tax=Leucinodes orbonalis TaxID=711050 RepID=A0AAU0QKC4_9NEOP|nr:odorant receptor [Leucinodes orbonalis]